MTRCQYCGDEHVCMGRDELSEIDEVLRRIPEPIEKLLFIRCPRCEHRTWRCHGGEYAGFHAHYLEHVIEDMENDSTG